MAGEPNGDLLRKLDELRREIEQSRQNVRPVPAPVNGDAGQAIQLLERGLAMRASDIHLDPVGSEVDVRFRIDGRLENYARLDPEIGRPLVNQLELLAGIDVVHHFEPREGRLRLPPPYENYHVRITTTPVTNGDAVAIRLLECDRLVRPLDQLGLADADQRTIERLLDAGEGLLLVTGPTGAGKTTTVYSMLHAMDNGARNIVTIEDPVELDLPSFRQVNVDHRHGLTMAAGLRTLLRMDPDIVMVGEIRDAETAEMTMRAAGAGKMVFSTLHTRDAASTITSLRDLRVDGRSLGSNLVGIIAQRLVRRLCLKCRRSRECSADHRPFFEEHGLEAPAELYSADGCQECRNRGYADRIGVFEVVPTSPELVAQIQSGASEEQIRDSLRRAGMRSLLQDGLQKVCRGLTSLSEVQHMHWGTAVSASQPLVRS